VKYYLNDFVKSRELLNYTTTDGVATTYHPDSSTLFYISIGTAFKAKRKQPLGKRDV
jgi:hypothetical protein